MTPIWCMDQVGYQPDQIGMTVRAVAEIAICLCEEHRRSRAVVEKWKAGKNLLYRGDDADEVSCPTPAADASLIRHIMYFEGPGRETPYLSTTESREVAAHFSRAGAIWETNVEKIVSNKVGHISNKELITLLKGTGKGNASWDSPSEVMQARRYVIEHSEHLLDFRSVDDPRAAATAIFQKS